MRFDLSNGSGISCRDDRFTSLKCAFLDYYYTRIFRSDQQVGGIIDIFNSIKR